jgi:hypothetical protein
MLFFAGIVDAVESGAGAGAAVLSEQPAKATKPAAKPSDKHKILAER